MRRKRGHGKDEGAMKGWYHTPGQLGGCCLLLYSPPLQWTAKFLLHFLLLLLLLLDYHCSLTLQHSAHEEAVRGE